jgi:hypothetical protein
MSRKFLEISSFSSEAEIFFFIPDTQLSPGAASLEEDHSPSRAASPEPALLALQEGESPEIFIDEGDFLNVFEEDALPSPPDLDAQEGPPLGAPVESPPISPGTGARPLPTPRGEGVRNSGACGVRDGHPLQHPHFLSSAPVASVTGPGSNTPGHFRSRGVLPPLPAMPCGFAGCNANILGSCKDAHLNEHLHRGESPLNKEWLSLETFAQCATWW